MGVDLFFVLSGFLITDILAGTRARPDYFRRFYARRALRILPAYFAAVIALGYVVPALRSTPGTGHGVGWLWLHAANFGVAFDRIPDYSLHFWSLGIEEQFYLVWPLAVLALSDRALRRLAVILLISAVAWRVAVMWFNLTSDRAVWWQYALPWARWDSLAMGALVALAYRSGKRPNPSRLLAAASGALVIAVGCMAADGTSTTLGPGWTRTFGFTAWAIAFAALLMLLLQGFGAGALSGRFLRYVGSRSYGLYIWHFLALAATTAIIPVRSLATALAAAAVGAVVAIVAAECSWQVVERHALALKSRIA